MDFIKTFENHSDYEQYAQDDLVTPNISFCVRQEDVHYNPFDYAKQYLTFDIISGGTFYWTQVNVGNFERTIYYSLDNGSTWNSLTSDTGSSAPSFTVEAGDRIMFKGNNATYAPLNQNNAAVPSKFTGNPYFNVKGNIMSLISGDSFAEATTIEGTHTFRGMFSGTNVVNAKDLVLPAATVLAYSYASMFSGCENLLTAPQLPASTLGGYCYQHMFSSCSGLTAAPQLPATALTQYCYSYMFQNCKSMASAPKILPAQGLTSNCYQGMFENCESMNLAPVIMATTGAQYACWHMFKGCTSLTSAPDLLIETLSHYIYRDMFNGCTNINYIKCLATSEISSDALSGWVSGVAANGTFIKKSTATWDSGISGIPDGWTVVDV